MSSNQQHFQVIKRASIVSALTNTFLSILKIIFGITGYSYALFSDGVHSFSDVVIDGLVLLSARMGAAAPDVDHPYGHRRIETIGTVLVALIILGVGISMLVENALRLIHQTAIPQPLPVVFVVAIISLLANEILYRYMMKKGNEIDSPLLKSNAWHNRSDALTSIVVLIGALFAWFGWQKMDSIAAILISLLVIKMGVKYAWNCLRELIDTGLDPKLVEELKTKIQSTPGVVSIHQLRSRLHAGHVLIDGHVQVSPYLSVSEGHYIGSIVYKRIKEMVPKLLDATLHIDVEDDEDYYLSDYQPAPDRKRILEHIESHNTNLPGAEHIQALTLHYLSKQVSIEILLPLSLLDNCKYNDILLQYRTCLYELPDLKSVSITFFRD